MKIFTLLICGLFFILAEAVKSQARHLLRQLEGASKKYNLDCESYLKYCNNPENKPTGITEELCPVILKAYLCDNVTKPDEMIDVLKEFAVLKTAHIS